MENYEDDLVISDEEPFEQEEYEEEEEEEEEQELLKTDYNVCDKGIIIIIKYGHYINKKFKFDYETTNDKMTEIIMDYLDRYRRDPETMDDCIEQEYLYTYQENVVKEITGIDFLDEYCSKTVMKSSRNVIN